MKQLDFMEKLFMDEKVTLKTDMKKEDKNVYYSVLFFCDSCGTYHGLTMLVGSVKKQLPTKYWDLLCKYIDKMNKADITEGEKQNFASKYVSIFYKEYRRYFTAKY